MEVEETRESNDKKKIYNCACLKYMYRNICLGFTQKLEIIL